MKSKVFWALGLGICGIGACVNDSQSGGDGGQDATANDAPADVTPEAAGDASDGSASAACNLTKPFGAPTPLPNITTFQYQEDGIWLTTDQLNAYVSATRPDSGSTTFDIFTTSRTALDASFGALVPLPGSVNVANQDERSPIAAADNLTLYYYSSAANHLYVSTRTSVSSSFGAGQAVAPPLGNTSNQSDQASWISPDGLTIYISSPRGDGVHEHIMVATRAATTVPFGAPTATGMPNSTADDTSAVLTADQLTMYFSSTQTASANTVNIWKATRSTVADGFGTPVLVNELNNSGFNYPSWVSPDGCTIYTVQHVYEGGVTYDLLVASKPAN
jgi:hypothetical protein